MSKKQSGPALAEPSKSVAPESPLSAWRFVFDWHTLPRVVVIEKVKGDEAQARKELHRMIDAAILRCVKE